MSDQSPDMGPQMQPSEDWRNLWMFRIPQLKPIYVESVAVHKSHKSNRRCQYQSVGLESVFIRVHCPMDYVYNVQPIRVKIAQKANHALP